MAPVPKRPNFLKDIQTLQQQMIRLRSIVGSLAGSPTEMTVYTSPDGGIQVEDASSTVQLTLGYQSSGGAIGLSTSGPITGGAIAGSTIQTGGGTVLSFTIGSDAYGTVLDVTTH